jgi:hypothetical protein
MGSQSTLREELGRNDIEVRFGDGKQYVTMDGKTVELSAEASAAEVAQALNLSKIDAAAQPAPAPVQAITAAPIAPVKSATTGLTGATHAGLSLKQMMADRKNKLAAARDKLETNFGKLDQATSALDSLGDDVGSEADDLLASIGQFKNDLG